MRFALTMRQCFELPFELRVAARREVLFSLLDDLGVIASVAAMLRLRLEREP
jgi:hypothetical protein